jgi:predicted HicB family RNase H-like nuclease
METGAKTYEEFTEKREKKIKFTARIPKYLHDELCDTVSQHPGIYTLNQFVLQAIFEKLRSMRVGHSLQAWKDLEIK